MHWWEMQRSNFYRCLAAALTADSLTFGFAVLTLVFAVTMLLGQLLLTATVRHGSWNLPIYFVVIGGLLAPILEINTALAVSGAGWLCSGLVNLKSMIRGMCLAISLRLGMILPALGVSLLPAQATLFAVCLLVSAIFVAPGIWLLCELRRQATREAGARQEADRLARAIAKLPRRTFKGQPTASLECAICLTEFEDGQQLITLPCKHEFKEECILKWLHGASEAPHPPSTSSGAASSTSAPPLTPAAAPPAGPSPSRSPSANTSTCPLCKMPIIGRDGVDLSRPNDPASQHRVSPQVC